ncbi:hypothetical protein LSH36_491g02038 [Paralvinella palmiformis]|uniref:peptidyl-tRNA hydrolase n=1 Tax=Paralvinella palmiformis TaxID=53620 RepID=A0AAD9J9R5_9ANNE|nr:hypothetical protein LSH36_491g02038 [Paralvinella palmiformis]
MAASMVQYVVIRRDLFTKLNWPVGAVIAQACHASSAVIHLYYTDPNTQEYLKDLDRMHKVILEADDEETLRSLSEKLKAGSIDHKALDRTT